MYMMLVTISFKLVNQLFLVCLSFNGLAVSQIIFFKVQSIDKGQSLNSYEFMKTTCTVIAAGV